MGQIKSWMGQKLLQDLAFTKYLEQIQEIQNKQISKKYDKLSPRVLMIFTALLGTNSIIFAFISFYKLGLSVKSLAIFSFVIYLNVCWHFVGYQLSFGKKLIADNSPVKYWHRKHFNMHFGKLPQINANTQYQQFYIKPFINDNASTTTI